MPGIFLTPGPCGGFRDYYELASTQEEDGMAMKTIVWTGVLCMLVCAYPRTANYFLWRDFTSANVDSLAKFDLLILDMEIQHNAPEKLAQLRLKNPSIKMLAYMCCQEIDTNSAMNGTQLLRKHLFTGIDSSWWLRDTRGRHVSFWPGTWMLNVTPLCRKVNGKQWTDYFAAFITDTILSTGKWDGFFIDNCWDNVAWVDGTIDANNDGVSDSAKIDSLWFRGMHQMLDTIRQKNPNAILMGNAGFKYGEYLNGAMMETFPKSYWAGWTCLMDIYGSLQKFARDTQYICINSNTENTGVINYQNMRFGLASALLGNAYFSYDYGDKNHGQNWWFDEYSIDLGQPVGEAKMLDSTLIKAEDFETGSTTYTINNYNSMNNQITANDLNGKYALSADATASTQQWNQFLETGASVPFPPNSAIRVAFNFKITSRSSNTKFYCIARHGTDYSKDIWFGNFGDLNNSNEVQSYSFQATLGSYSDYNFIWGIENQGSLIIDDIRFYNNDRCVYSREFQKGYVVCNASSGPSTITLPKQLWKFKGNQASAINNGLSVTQLTLAAYDGIVLVNVPPVSVQTSFTTPSIKPVSISYNKWSSSFNLRFNNTGNTPISFDLFNLQGKRIFHYAGMLNSTQKGIRVYLPAITSGLCFFSLAAKHHSEKGIIIF
jgi:hypothetical protein